MPPTRNAHPTTGPSRPQTYYRARNCSGLRGSEQLSAGGEGVEALYAPGAED